MFEAEIEARRAELLVEAEELVGFVDGSAEVRQKLARVYRDLTQLQDTAEASLKAARKILGLHANYGEEDGVRICYAEALVMALSYQSEEGAQDRIVKVVEALARMDPDLGRVQAQYVNALGVRYGQAMVAGEGGDWGERFCRELSLQRTMPETQDVLAGLGRFFAVIGVDWPCV